MCSSDLANVNHFQDIGNKTEDFSKHGITQTQPNPDTRVLTGEEEVAGQSNTEGSFNNNNTHGNHCDGVNLNTNNTGNADYALQGTGNIISPITIPAVESNDSGNSIEAGIARGNFAFTQLFSTANNMNINMNNKLTNLNNLNKQQNRNYLRLVLN